VSAETGAVVEVGSRCRRPEPLAVG
jgi:hypothetical protein